jgi:5-methylcytosine-specific restriction endonuclease McrA
MVEFTCFSCRRTFLQYPGNRICKRAFCSHKCYADTLRVEKAGKAAPHFDAKKWVEIRRRNGTYRFTEEWRRNISLANRRRNMVGPNNPNWRGGRDSEHARLRKTFRYTEWRKAVFERDDYTCVICRQRGGTLNADHIKPFAFFPDLRFELSNGRTLCVKCHKKHGWHGNQYQNPNEQKKVAA